MTTTTFIPCADAASLRALIAPWTAADPAPYAVVCSLAERFGGAAWGGVILRDGEPVVAFAQTPPRAVILATPLAVDAELANQVVAVLRQTGRPVSGIYGPQPWAEAIAAALGVEVTRRRGLRLHRLIGEARAPTAPTGAARWFAESELPLLRAWTETFSTEIGEPGLITPETAAALRPNCLAWTVDGVPVSMARRARPVFGGWSINSVYTPPEQRGRGYAGALVADLSRRLVAEGASYVALYTDLDNPTSNRLYARIGFVPVLDSAQLTWNTP